MMLTGVVTFAQETPKKPAKEAASVTDFFCIESNSAACCNRKSRTNFAVEKPNKCCTLRFRFE